LIHGILDPLIRFNNKMLNFMNIFFKYPVRPISAIAINQYHLFWDVQAQDTFKTFPQTLLCIEAWDDNGNLRSQLV
ncbi:MAG: hypothetical protein AAF193_04695, partial [Bacteroidota bacterium]